MSNIFAKTVKNVKLWFGILILAVFIIKFDVDFSIVKTIEPTYFILALGVILLELFVRVFRWNRISDTLFKKTDFLQSSKIYFIGQTLNEVAPQGTGEISKAYLSYKSYGEKGRSILAPVLERMIDISFLVLASFFVVFLLPVDISRYLLPLSFMVVVFVFMLALFTKPRYIEKIAGFFIRLATKNRKGLEKNTISWKGVTKTKVFGLYLLTILCWGLEAVVQSFLLFSFGYSVSPLLLISMISFSWLVAVPTFLPGGIGARDVVYSYLLSLAGVPLAVGGAFVIVYRMVIWTVMGILGGLSYATYKKIDMGGVA